MSTIVEGQNSAQKKADEEQKKGTDLGLNRSKLVARLLAAGPDLPAFLNDLITVQAIVVNGTEAAAFILEQSPQGISLRNVAHIRPDSSDNETRTAALQAFTEIVGTCLQQGKDGVIDVGSPNDSVEPQFCLVTLLRNGDQVIAASAVITRCRDQERAQQRLDTMRLVAGYFDMFMLKRAGEQSAMLAQNHQDVLQAASSFATGDGFMASAMNLCNELSARTGASRVSLGWMRGRHIKLQALSHTEQFDKRQELSVQIVKVMEECADQNEVVQFEPEGNSTQNVSRAAQALSKMENGHRVISMPLRHKAEVVGVLTLEFSRERPITPQAATGLAVAAEVLSPQLYDRYQNDRWLITKAGLSVADNTKKLFFLRQHTLAKVITLGVVGLIAFLCLFKPMYRVKAPFSFVAETRRITSAPFAGRIDKVSVKPGDKVEAGQELVVFDTRELQQKQFAAARQAEASRTAAKAYRADPQRSKMAEAIQEDKRAEASEAEADLYKMQIDKATVKAPIAGVVLRGDLKEKEGSEVKIGDPLFEIGQPGLRAEIRVADADVQKVRDAFSGQASKGELATKSQPGDTHGFVVERIIPAAVAKDGTSTVTVYATMNDQNADWQPGMEGEARIEWQKKPLIWHGTHRLIDWVRLKLWM